MQQPDNRPTDAPMLLSTTEAGRVMGISKKTVYSLMRAGQITSVMVEGRRLVPRSTIEDFIQRRQSYDLAFHR